MMGENTACVAVLDCLLPIGFPRFGCLNAELPDFLASCEYETVIRVSVLDCLLLPCLVSLDSKILEPFRD